MMPNMISRWCLAEPRTIDLPVHENFIGMEMHIPQLNPKTISNFDS